MNKIRINQGRILPWQFRMVGTLIVLGSMAFALLRLSEFPAIVICIAISFLIPAMWSAYYILEIDPEQKTISEFSWVLSFKNGKTKSFQEVEKIFVNETKKAQRMTSWSGQVRTSKFNEYMAFLKLVEGDKYFLISDPDPANLMKRLTPISEKLGCDIHENYEKT
ncbi:hypothetical protein [Marinoscillum sp. 108]|uniref:hypothetical protein n=1 Tax=Marinoscillum sp. 108 TaxID=2653151 RepID=UPI0013599C9B|nr:hypothetical protein [Marinoscillum sp. 108]